MMTTVLTLFLTLLLLLLLVITTANEEGSSSSSSHLEEIMLGRCYYDPPFSSSSSSSSSKLNDEDLKEGEEEKTCPGIVDSFITLLSNHPDSTLQADDFFDFIQQVDFTFDSSSSTAGAKQPMIWLQSMAHDDTTIPTFPVDLPPPFYVTPESTPGGKLMQDLMFCGSNQNECTMETSRAYWKFWQAAYYKFTQSLLHLVDQGKDETQEEEEKTIKELTLTIVVEPYADVQFLERSIMPVLVVGNNNNMIPQEMIDQRITSVIIYETTGNCQAANVQKLLHILEGTGVGGSQQQQPIMEHVECKRSIWELWDHPPHNNPTTSTTTKDQGNKGAEEEDTATAPESKEEEKKKPHQQDEKSDSTTGSLPVPPPPPPHSTPTPTTTTSQSVTFWLLLTYMTLVLVSYYCVTKLTSRSNSNKTTAAGDPTIDSEDWPLLGEKKKLYHDDEDDDSTLGDSVDSITRSVEEGLGGVVPTASAAKEHSAYQVLQ